MNEAKFAELTKKLERGGSLPTLPTVALRVIDLTRNPKSQISDYAKVIETDPALAARILKMANGSFYGRSGNVANLQSALVLLGLREIRNLALSLAVFHTLPAQAGQVVFDRERFWTHSIACAYIAQMIAQELKLPDPDKYYVGGLLHDVGKIVLDHYFHDKFSDVLKFVTENGLSTVQAEEFVFGCNHSDIGEWLAAKWKFPPHVCDAIAGHHRPDAYSTDNLVPAVVHLADLFSGVHGVGFGGSLANFVFEDDAAVRHIQHTHPAILEVDPVVFIGNMEREVERASETMKVRSEVKGARVTGRT